MFLYLVLAAVLVGTGIATFFFYACWYYERQAFPETAAMPGEAPPRGVRMLAGMLREWLSLAFLVITWPLRVLHDASPVRMRKRGETPVILVHGYGGDSANFLLMQWALKLRGWANVYAVSYTPPTINARRLAQQVADHVDRILAATGAEKAHIVGHSMAGPLSRYALQHLGLAGKVDRVITLGSPHNGTRIANLFPPRGAAAQLRYDSPFIRELNELDQTPGGARFFSIWSDLDNFVLPVTSPVLSGNAQNIRVTGLGHVSLLYSWRVLKLVESCLRAPEVTEQEPESEAA